MSTSIFYSTDDESYNHDSLGDLIDSMDDPQVGSTYFEADGARLKPTDGIDSFTVESILEGMDERIGDELGECYSGDICRKASPDARAELLASIQAWAEKHIELSNYWKLASKSRKRMLTADDLGLE